MTSLHTICCIEHSYSCIQCDHFITCISNPAACKSPTSGKLPVRENGLTSPSTASVASLNAMCPLLSKSHAIP